MKVKNLEGSSEQFPSPVCKCSTWIEHWENNRIWKDGKKYLAGYCRKCGKEVEHKHLNGAHVIKVGSEDKKRYIIPLCDSCHGMTNAEFDVKEEDLVSANCSCCKKE